jgi:hypothetical protein
MRIDPQEKKLYELLSGNQQYEIPMYQRNYDWKAENVQEFLYDLELAMDNKGDHFFGSIVIISPEHGSDSFQVIDGQQRMTTFFLLIAIIRDLVDEFADAKYVRNGKAVNLDSITASLLFSDDTADFRFAANSRIRDVFNKYVLLDPASAGRKQLVKTGAGMISTDKKESTVLRRNYFLIQDWLRGWLRPYSGDDEALKGKIFNLLATIKSSAKVLRLEVGNEDDAFLLFETMNHRGLALTPSDLLKSYTLRAVNGGESTFVMEDALDSWDEAVDSLGSYPFTKFLRHYLLSVQGGEKVQVSKIFAMFKSIIKGYGHGGAIRNLHELAEGARDYAKILGEGSTDDEKLNKVVGRLNLLSETHRILMLKAMRLRFSHDQLRKLAIAIEVLAFRWIITGGNAQQIESFYQKQAASLNSDNPAELANVIREVILMSPSDDAVQGAMIQNQASRIADHQFYVLQRINFGLTKSDLNWNRKKIHIEHLAPQRPADKHWFEAVAPVQSTDPNAKLYDDYLNQWGNLTLLEYSINTTIGNADWQTKVAGKDASVGLSSSQISMTNNLVSLREWNKDSINARTAWIAGAMVQLTSLDDYHSPGMVAQFVEK